ncbi:MAG: serine/threonine protein kinase [Myxococcota bacterium]|jgi:serine/threonine protein kinase
MSRGYPRRFGAYILLERLGVGGMSEVDLARRASDPEDYVRLVVLKRIKADRHDDKSFVRMFRDEARITSHLHHQNIAQLFDFGQVDDEYFLALEYIPGVDLREVQNAAIEKGKRLPIRVTLTILCNVLSALDYAHSRVNNVGKSMNIVHRDVNPRNIMLSTRGEVKLIDFGVAKAEDRLERTRTDHVKGKFAYMAPEQVDGSGIDNRADLFAIGLTMHEMVAGQGPFHGLSQVQILHKLMSGRLPSLPPVSDLPNPDSLSLVHERALAADKEDRYPNANAMRKDLETVADTVGGLCTPLELMAFLRRLDPQIERRLQDKITTFSGKIDLPPIAHEPTPIAPLDAHEVTRDAPPPMLLDNSSSGTAVRSIGIAFGGAAVAAALFGVIALVTLLVGIYVWTLPVERTEALVPAVVTEVPSLIPVIAEPSGDSSEPSPSDLQPRPEPSEPRTAPAPVERLGPTSPSPVMSESVALEPVVVAPEPVVVAPEPVVVVPEPVVVVPEPVVPEPVVVVPQAVLSAPEPTPAAEPEAVFGTIQVTSAIRGLAILLDGEDTGRVTPARMRATVGAHSVQVDGFTVQTITVRDGLVTNALFR